MNPQTQGEFFDNIPELTGFEPRRGSYGAKDWLNYGFGVITAQRTFRAWDHKPKLQGVQIASPL